MTKDLQKEKTGSDETIKNILTLLGIFTSAMIAGGFVMGTISLVLAAVLTTVYGPSLIFQALPLIGVAAGGIGAIIYLVFW